MARKPHRSSSNSEASAIQSSNRHIPHAARSFLGDSVLVTVVVLGIVSNLFLMSTALPQIAARTEVTTTLSGSWTLSSPLFARHAGQQLEKVYYAAVELNVPLMGTYSFTGNSAIRMDGRLYDGDFDPADPNQNLITFDVKSADQEQFEITASLQADHKYTLIVTPRTLDSVGEFSVASSGPASISLPRTISPSTSPTQSSSPTSSSLQATYSGSFSSSSPIFIRPQQSEGSFYYQALYVTVDTNSTFTFTSSSTIDTYGILYNYPADPSYPNQNLIMSDDDSDGGRQFRIIAALTSGSTYVLIVTTYAPAVVGSFSVRAYGASTVALVAFTPSTIRPIITPRSTTTSPVISTYSGSLSSRNPIYSRPGNTGSYYYYQAIRVTVPTTGTYMFSSISSIDTFGYLYNDPVDPSYPNQNVIASDDDSGGSLQFRIVANLYSGSSYVLLVTTAGPSVLGIFSIQAYGPSSISLTAFNPSTSRPIGTTTASLILSSYSGYLSADSPTFIRSGGSTAYYYYQAIRLTVRTSGTYSFTSVSSIDTYGYLYNSPVDPSYPSQNLITSDDDSGGGNQFLIVANLYSGSSYVLLVTTHGTNVFGSFSVRVSGPSSIDLTAFNPSTSRPIGTTSSPTVQSSYSDYLSSSSPTFIRSGGSTAYYYYQAIRLTVRTSGTYSFTSVSSIDTYGYLYNSPVDPSYPSQNLITSDDDSGGSSQFRVQAYLSSGSSYVLIVTTFSTNVFGSFSVRASGPSLIDMTGFKPSTSRPIRTTTSCGYYSSCRNYNTLGPSAIIGIIAGCLILVALIIFSSYVCQRNRATTVRRVNVPSSRPHAAPGSSYPLRDVNRNAPRAHGSQGPYTIAMPHVHNMYVEQPPPAYESIRPMSKMTNATA